MPKLYYNCPQPKQQTLFTISAKSVVGVVMARVNEFTISIVCPPFIRQRREEHFSHLALDQLRSIAGVLRACVCARFFFGFICASYYSHVLYIGQLTFRSNQCIVIVLHSKRQQQQQKPEQKPSVRSRRLSMWVCYGWNPFIKINQTKRETPTERWIKQQQHQKTRNSSEL